MLTNLISRYLDAKAVWEAQFSEDCDKAGSSPEWDTFVDAGDNIISYHCKGETLRRKAELLLSDDFLFDTLENTTGSGPLRRFLASLSGPTSVIELRIEEHRSALAKWRATAGPDMDLECEGDAYAKFTQAEFDFVVHQCFSQEEIQLKLTYVSECREMRESIHIDRNGEGVSYQTLFLRSLQLPSPVDNQPVENGENGENCR